MRPDEQGAKDCCSLSVSSALSAVEGENVQLKTTPSSSSNASSVTASNPACSNSCETSFLKAEAATAGGRSGRGFSRLKGTGGGEGVREELGVGEREPEALAVGENMVDDEAGGRDLTSASLDLGAREEVRKLAVGL